MMVEFKNRHSFENRLNESQSIMCKYPNRIPIICEKNKDCKITMSLSKVKYLIPFTMLVGEFILYIRRTININKEQGIYLFINGNIPCTSDNFFNLYHNYKDNDGFLYIIYTYENTFGC